MASAPPARHFMQVTIIVAATSDDDLARIVQELEDRFEAASLDEVPGVLMVDVDTLSDVKRQEDDNG